MCIRDRLIGRIANVFTNCFPGSFVTQQRYCSCTSNVAAVAKTGAIAKYGHLFFRSDRVVLVAGQSVFYFPDMVSFKYVVGVTERFFDAFGMGLNQVLKEARHNSLCSLLQATTRRFSLPSPIK